MNEKNIEPINQSIKRAKEKQAMHQSNNQSMSQSNSPVESIRLENYLANQSIKLTIK